MPWRVLPTRRSRSALRLLVSGAFELLLPINRSRELVPSLYVAL